MVVLQVTQTFKKVGRVLERFGFTLIYNWYEGTRFTPAIRQLPQ
jgi:hypothetical protein